MGQKDPLEDRHVQALLNKFMSGKIEAITPIFDLKKGLVYSDIDEILGDSMDDEEFLAMLHKAGVLKRELYDKVICCPKCRSMNVSVHYSCPYCRSFDIKKSSLIEHVKCGYMDVEEKFYDGERLVCPKCKRELAHLDVDFRKAGVWCTCNKCGKSFDMPIPNHFCRDCSHFFLFEDALVKDAYSYHLNEDVVKGAALNWAVLAPVRKLMEERGLKVDTPGFLEGKSGVRHMFDMVACNNGRKPDKIAINVFTSADGKPVPEQSVIDMFAKTYDSKVEKAFLIAIPKIGESGKKLANLYKINVVEAKSPDDALEKIKESLQL